MIVSSQISFLQENSRHTTAFDQSQLRINQQRLPGAGNGNSAGNSQLNVIRDAAYKYTSQERFAIGNQTTASPDALIQSQMCNLVLEKLN